MLHNKKVIVILGLAAAYAYYKYSKMSPVEKTALRQKVKNVFEEYLPEDLKNMLGIQAGNDEFENRNSFFKPGL